MGLMSVEEMKIAQRAEAESILEDSLIMDQEASIKVPIGKITYLSPLAKTQEDAS